ncbi:Pantothenate kinase 1 [Hondaea fermentalgiana]|uniref:Pantothenate kinase 1 n=1 Tax=Hondaea fermentalgiana TaxID=2315210 RepID=A0A2R5FZP5_9STRA|nr:Pantothenate kinase 1 [Hondaea fermentalgiana]|eukprot:GBG24237.1 Pantothenate kinase 1 [Hondaea fermentalgiana]
MASDDEEQDPNTASSPLSEVVGAVASAARGRRVDDRGGSNADERDSSNSRPTSPVRKRQYSYSDLGFTSWDEKPLTWDAGMTLGLDFGGTLSKIVFFEPKEVPGYANPLADFLLKRTTYGHSGERDTHLSFYSEKLGGRLHFISFETSRTHGAIQLLKKLEGHNIRRVHATGGGAYKFSQLIKDELGIRLLKQDELETVVRGIIFTLLEHPNSECYSYEANLDDLNESAREGRHHGVSHDALSYEMRRVPRPMPVESGSFFPLLVVNIGSGVSIINVTSPSSFKRVSGTAVGGATYYGLCKLLCRCDGFKEAMDLAELGDSRDVNLTVQDIYGGSYELAGLSGEITASFFGKAAAARGRVRTKRSRKRRYVSYLERLSLVIIALLVANLLVGSYVSFTAGSFDLRDLILVLLPGGMAYLVFWSTEAKMTSSHPPDDRPPAADPPLHSMRGPTDKATLFEEADIARALVVMVAQNVTQIAFLNARLHKSKRVLFTGNFLRHNRIALRALSSMMQNWSRGSIQALFMEHEGYFGAIGTFLYSIDKSTHQQPDDEDMDNDTNSQESGGDEASEEEIDVVQDLLFRGAFPRRRTAKLDVSSEGPRAAQPTES